jgi:hypothetical protein
LVSSAGDFRLETGSVSFKKKALGISQRLSLELKNVS